VDSHKGAAALVKDLLVANEGQRVLIYPTAHYTDTKESVVIYVLLIAERKGGKSCLIYFGIT